MTLCVHLSVCVQDNNGVERTFGDCAVRKKYSHIDLIHMIDGVETQKATICAGNRCYYLKVCTVYSTTTIVASFMLHVYYKQSTEDVHVMWLNWDLIVLEFCYLKFWTEGGWCGRGVVGYIHVANSQFLHVIP